jgi:hypothetical protein
MTEEPTYETREVAQALVDTINAQAGKRYPQTGSATVVKLRRDRKTIYQIGYCAGGISMSRGEYVRT